MNISENAAYLKGLFDGYEIDKSSKEGKIIGGMLDLIAKMAERINELSEECSELRDYAEELDEDLGALEEEIYLTDDAEDDDYEDLNDDEDYEPDDDSGYYELECPSCGEVICFDDSLDPENLVCPACGEAVNDVGRMGQFDCGYSGRTGRNVAPGRNS